MMWRWETRDPPPIRRAAQGIAPIRAAQGILWLGRHALYVHCEVISTARCVAPIFRHCLGRRRVNATS
jgi:hypothetical protein